MLPRPNRLTDGADYRAVVRRGARSARPTMVSYVVSAEHDAPRFGFIVSKKVGNAVVRNRVRRRLKAICFEQRTRLRPDVDVVIRALPAAASVPFAVLRDDVERSLARSRS